MTARASVLVLSGAAAIALPFSLPVSARQGAPAADSTPSPLVIQVGLELIQMDAVVTDRSGRQVTDLRPEDFTLEVDGKKQNVANTAYFGPSSGAAGPPALAGSPAEPGPGSNRTVVVIIDDLNMSFASMYATRRALAIFAKEMGPSPPLVALRLASDETSQFSLFRSADRFASMASGLQYNIRSSKGMSSARGGSAPSISIATTLNRTSLAAQAVSTLTPTEERRNLEQRAFSLLSTLNAMRAIPGRKAVVFVSEGFYVDNQINDRINQGFAFGSLFDDTDLTAALRMITEVANRASVVLYTIDPRGLMVDFPGVSENVTAPQATLVMASRWEERVRSQASLQYLADDTGGLTVVNRGDLQGGFGDVLRDQGAYYLIGFEPPENAFAKKSGRPKFHKIKLSVNRKDVRVRTRAGFYGVTDEEVIKRAPLLATP